MRLNKEIKQEILNNAIKKSALVTEANALISERAEIAEKLRRQFVSEEVENEINALHEKLRSLEKETGVDLYNNYSTSPEIQININGCRHDVLFSGFEYDVSTNILKKFDRNNHVRKIISRSKRYVVTDDCGLLENEKKCEKLLERYNSLTTQVNAILSKCNTDGQLLKLWPESAELIPKDIAKPSTALMVKTDELNTILGLPSGKS